MFTTIDTTIIAWLNHFAGRSWVFDYAVYTIADSNLLKGGLFLTLFWGLWFRRSGDPVKTRTIVTATLAACTLAIVINQGTQLITPFRPRPYVAHLQGINYPYDLGMKHESSFPSDHAALFFSLSIGLLFLSWRLGVAMSLYTLIVICIPRVYLGLHYPSDLLGGALIGIGCACLMNATPLRGWIARPALALSEKYPGLFYAGGFLYTLLLATLLDDLRTLGRLVSVILHG